MRIVSANVFCLNPRPRAAMEAIAAQDADVVVLIESVRRFQKLAERMLPPARLRGRTRADGMPVTLHAKDGVPVGDAREDGEGWLEASVGDVSLFVVHAVAPYLPWRWPRRERQLVSLARRMSRVDAARPGLTIGDFNTADFEPAWGRYEEAIAPWQRLDCAVSGPGPGKARGTWPLGRTWAPVALDHAMATPVLAGGAALVRTFGIPWSDHRGLVVDLPAGVAGLPSGLPLRVS